ncbi:anti-sigma factor [Nocardia sp. NPDC056064]|uniref:anti-sigma factor n=1 Tax=Nocardia sp. NPDC056064 TaxID=3345701 RepID=UPI0035D57044
MHDQQHEPVPRQSTVGFQVPAELDQLTMAHAVAETILLVSGFALDEVTDLLLALDEVTTALVLAAVPGARIDCAFTGGDGVLGARVTTVTRAPRSIDEDAFGWHVVATLTDALRTDYGDYDSACGGFPATVEFGWIRRSRGTAVS